MSLRKLVAADFVQDSRDALEAMLEFPTSVVEMIKNEPGTLVWRTLLGSDLPAVVKTYRQRSLYDFSREALTRFRVQREFESLGFLRSNSIPCARPICWSYGRNAMLGRFESLATCEEPYATGLRDYLESELADDRWIEPAASLVRRGHDVGFYHGALASRNMLIRLVDGQSAACIFIDTPRSIIFPRAIVGTRMAQHDLLVLLGDVYRLAGEPAVRNFLATYGWPTARIPGLAEQIRNYRATRNTRNRMRAEFLIRRLVT